MDPLGFTCTEGRDPNPKPRLGKPDAVGAKGAVGPPVNCCTMARKFVVSVLSRVVGVRLEARDRRRMGFETRPSGLNWVCSGGLVVEMVVVTVVASETEDGST